MSAPTADGVDSLPPGRWQDLFDPGLRRVAVYDDGVVMEDDAVSFLKGTPSDIADIVFLDPPFNLGKRYGALPAREDRLPPRNYEDYMGETLSLAVRALKPGGSLFLYHLPKFAMSFGERLKTELDFRHWIAISMKNGFSHRAALYPAHYALLYFTKGIPSHFVRPKVPVSVCRHCGKPIKDYGGYAKHVEDGLSLSDFWDDISPVRHKSRKSRGSNELPARVMDRILGMAGHHGGLIVDPFAGSGSTGVAARRVGMRFVLNDRDAASCEVITSRLRHS
jgi:site-specific DNA-methyltransferase (adenine-specific)